MASVSVIHDEFSPNFSQWTGKPVIKLKWETEYKDHLEDGYLKAQLVDTKESVDGTLSGLLGGVLLGYNNVLYTRGI